MKIIEKLENKISNLGALVGLSKEGKKVAVKYSEDILVCEIDLILSEDNERGISSEEEIVLKEGFYFKDKELYIKNNIYIVYNEICNDHSGILGTTLVGTVNGEPFYAQCLVAEDDENKDYIGLEVLIVE